MNKKSINLSLINFIHDYKRLTILKIIFVYKMKNTISLRLDWDLSMEDNFKKIVKI